MNLPKTKRAIITVSLLVGLALLPLLLTPLLTAAKEAPNSVLLNRAAMPAASPIITGAYAGTIAITEPVQLGVLDLAFNLTNNGNTFSGTIDPARTLVFADGPTLSGSITGSINGITPTFTINSAVFTGTVSGRQVQRQVALSGEVWENGNILQGIYTEVIRGFTPQPLTTRGIFMVTRAAQTVDFVPQPTLLVQVDPASVPPNGSATVTVTLLDGSLQPIANAQVTFSSDKGTFSPATVTTNSEGEASTTFTAGATPGLGTITASSSNIVGSRPIVIPSEILTMTTNVETLTFGAQTIVTVTLQPLSSNSAAVNLASNGVAGQVITFTATLGTIFPITSTTNANGQATTIFIAGDFPGQARVTAETETAVVSKIIFIASQTGHNQNTYLPLILKSDLNQ